MDEDRFDAAADVVFRAYPVDDDDPTYDDETNHAYAVACNAIRIAAEFQIKQYQTELGELLTASKPHPITAELLRTRIDTLREFARLRDCEPT